ncbi:MAG: hypothetical protein JWN30_1878 [Bacilli bacterium]|nr:hypothetical protein [Bacilli bacterium]
MAAFYLSSESARLFLTIRYTIVSKEVLVVIVRVRDSEFVMVQQHHHAFISGELARNFRTEFFDSDDYFEDSMLAIYEHDRSWIGMDLVPIWNDRVDAPYSFSDYPLLPKLLFYTKGLDEVQAINKYAGLLCSKHYSSFFVHADDSESKAFFLHEQERQSQILNELSCKIESLAIDFRWLQLCDDLSLYVCLNEPGSTKEQEHRWYRNGFRNSELFNSQSNQQLVARWEDRQRIVVEGKPFRDEFKIALKYKVVSKELIRLQGIERAYHLTDWTEESITFC